MKQFAFISFATLATMAADATSAHATGRLRDVLAVPAMQTDLRQVWQGKPIEGKLSLLQDGSISFTGHARLAGVALADDGVTEGDNVKQFLLQVSKLPSVALRHVAEQDDVNGHTHYYVQYIHDVPIEGTYAMAVAQERALTYAHEHLTRTPDIDTTPRIDADTAATAAVQSQQATAGEATLHDGQPTRLVVVYVDGTAHLAWRVGVKIRAPYETRAVYVDATNGDILVARKSSQDGVAGHVQFKVERLCAGDKPEIVNMPNIQWTNGRHTNSKGAFNSTRDISQADVALQSRWVKITNEGGKLAGPWKIPLVASPADNDVEITDAPLDQADPFYHVLTVRHWMMSHVSKTTPLGRWGKKQMRVNVNVPDTCNAYYDGDLNFFSEGDGCMNTGRTAGIVFHEYGHGIHEHAPPAEAWVPMDGQVSEGIGDFIAATITNNPKMRGVFSCHDNIRDCENELTFCESGCDFDLYSEAHDAGQVMCGVWWELRQHMVKRYGKKRGVTETDKLHLRFLALVGDMESAYEAAIAADEDADHNPDNGTDHSCQINRAFASDAKGATKHFPQLKRKVPCQAKAELP